MADITPFALSKIYSQLLGRDVKVSLKARSGSARPKLIYGVYKTVPQGEITVIRSDLALMGSLGGMLLGFPNDSVEEQLRGNLGEPLRDGIHEVFNITSTPLSTNGRIVFQTMHTELDSVPDGPRSIVRSAGRSIIFEVSIPEYTGGELSILVA